jgi:hypothetical protein
MSRSWATVGYMHRLQFRQNFQLQIYNTIYQHNYFTLNKQPSCHTNFQLNLLCLNNMWTCLYISGNCKELKIVVKFVMYLPNHLHYIISPPVNEPFVGAIFGGYKSPWIPVGSSRKWHQLTRESLLKLCSQGAHVHISIFCVSTDPS